MKSYYVAETRIGFIALAGKNGKLTHSTLPKPTRDLAIQALGVAIDDPYVESGDAFGDLPDKLRDYAESKRVDFSDVLVDLDVFGEFHATALKACQMVPHGEVVTYAGLARMAGRERAARAAGSAMANNMTPIIIPCHRVVASGGKIGGFSSGLEWKKTLLKLEGLDI